MKELSLKEIQQCSIAILAEVDRICREHDIQYFLFYGSLIGAVRHQGFIPWDDDIDIALKRDDYEKLLYYLGNESQFRIVNYKTDSKCPYTITRVSDDRYRMISKYGCGYQLGVFIDVYPLDGMGTEWKKAKRLARKGRKAASNYRKSCEKNIVGMAFDLHSNILTKLYSLLSYGRPKVLGREYYKKKIENMNQTYDFSKSKYIGWIGDENECILEKKLLDNSVDMKFETLTVKIPKEYDRILTYFYGDYMKLPDERDRVAHHFYRIYKI